MLDADKVQELNQLVFIQPKKILNRFILLVDKRTCCSKRIGDATLPKVLLEVAYLEREHLF